MNKDIVPIFGAHTSGDKYTLDLKAALNAKRADLVPSIYGWPETTAKHLIKTQPTFLAVDGIDSYTNPRTIPYAFPLNPFELKGGRERMFLVGADILSSTPHRGMRNLASDTVERYWTNEGDNNDEQLLRGQNGGLKDHLGMAALATATVGVAVYDTNLGLALLGVSLAYAVRLPIHKKLFEIQEEQQLVRSSPLFRGLLNATLPLSMDLTTITFRNAFTSLKLNDVKSRYSVDPQKDEQAVALFGNGHALGEYVWENEEVQKRVVTREVNKMKRIAQELNGESLSSKQNEQLAEDIANYLGGIGIWKILDRPEVLNYRNFNRAVHRLDPTVSDSIGVIVKGVFTRS